MKKRDVKELGKVMLQISHLKRAIELGKEVNDGRLKQLTSNLEVMVHGLIGRLEMEVDTKKASKADELFTKLFPLPGTKVKNILKELDLEESKPKKEESSSEGSAE